MVKHVSVKDTCMDTTIFWVYGNTVYMVKHVSVKDTCMDTTI